MTAAQRPESRGPRESWPFPSAHKLSLAHTWGMSLRHVLSSRTGRGPRPCRPSGLCPKALSAVHAESVCVQRRIMVWGDVEGGPGLPLPSQAEGVAWGAVPPGCRSCVRAVSTHRSVLGGSAAMGGAEHGRAPCGVGCRSQPRCGRQPTARTCVKPWRPRHASLGPTAAFLGVPGPDCGSAPRTPL